MRTAVVFEKLYTKVWTKIPPSEMLFCTMVSRVIYDIKIQNVKSRTIIFNKVGNSEKQ